MKMAERVGIITGAGGYLGRGIAVRLAEEGSSVLVNDKNMGRALETVKIVAAKGGKAIASESDITNAHEVKVMVDQAINKWGRIDFLVNNAGDFRDALLTKLSEEDWDFVIDLNLKGTFLCTQAVATYMIERKYGKIVNISSIAYNGNVGQTNYASAKAGIVGLTKSLGLELARYGINVNCVAPGLIETPRTHTLEKTTRDRLIERTPLKCMGEIVDVANAVLFLVCNDSKFITREIMHVSGGMIGF